MNYWDPRAEAIKRLREESVPELKSGDLPRSIRKRGFHRALKRKESWALAEEFRLKMLKEFRDKLYTAIPDPNVHGDTIYLIDYSALKGLTIKKVE